MSVERKQDTDLVLVHAYQRPTFLYSQVRSFIESQHACSCACGEHVVRFIVVLDSHDSALDQAFREQVARIQSYLNDYALGRNWAVDYWDRERQLRLLGPMISGEDSFFTDAASRRFGGVRATQNISQAIADHAAKEGADPVVHRVDDDVFPYVLDWAEPGVYRVARIDGFFCAKRKALDADATRIVGSYYTLDAPSLITDLFEVAEALHTLVLSIGPESAAAAKFDWQSVADRIYLYGAPVRFVLSDVSPELERLIDPCHLTPTDSSRVVLAWLADSLDLFGAGVNRFEYNVDRYARETRWFGPRNYLPGGCVSHRAGEPNAPFPNFGDQDLLWTYNEHLRRGGVAGDFSVLHVKTPLGREGLLSTVCNLSESDVRSSFALTIAMQQILRERSGARTSSLPDLRQFGGFGSGVFDLTEQRLRAALERLHALATQPAASSSAVAVLAASVARRVQTLLERYPQVRQRYDSAVTSASAERIIGQVESWLGSEAQWWELRARLRTRSAS